MGRKELTSKEDLFFIADLLERMKIRYWLVGGWGVDVLAGKQYREHRDIDINFDEQYTDVLIAELLEAGYLIDTDLRPLRIELYSDRYGYIDIHPFVVNDDGSCKKSDLNDGWWEFDADYFGVSDFEGKKIPCLSVKGQKAFHSGYELREKDMHDISVLDSLQ